MNAYSMIGPDEELWVACFQGPNNEPYLLVREFTAGMESAVQLLVHQHTGKLIVRKVPHRIKHKSFGKTVDLVTAANIEAYGADSNEIQMVKYLIPFTKRSPSARMYELIENRVIDVGAADSKHFLRESFWMYYNAGSLDDLAQLYQDRLIYPPPSLVARIIHQVLASIEFMLSSGRGVLHRDLHFGNIFVHWDSNDFLPNMYLADFGDAKFIGQDTADRGRRMCHMILEDASIFGRFLVDSWYFPPNLAKDARFTALARALECLRLQDLPAVIQQAKMLESASLAEEGENKVVSYFELFENHQMRNPCVAKTWTCEAIARRETRDLPGPFQLRRLL